VADSRRERFATQRAGGDVHQQGRGRDAWPDRSLLGVPAGALWIGTFHGLAWHRLLRIRWREARLPQTFQILDAEDQLRVVRKVLKALELDETRWVPREVTWFINAQKDEGLRPKQIKDNGDPTRREYVRVYQAYQEACERAGVVDFAELLLRVRAVARQRDSWPVPRAASGHLLVDEFQDTNAIQYRWLRLIAGNTGTPFVVGDDDQSIYRWRGARVENLQQFQRDFPATRLFRLEQNYRSTGTILKAANALIANNSSRLGKNLWTSGEQGAPIKLYAAFNERDEADFVINRFVSGSGTVTRGVKSPSCIARMRSGVRGGVLSAAIRTASMEDCDSSALRSRCARLPAPHRQPRRRPLIRARGQPARARHRSRSLEIVREVRQGGTAPDGERHGACVHEAWAPRRVSRCTASCSSSRGSRNRCAIWSCTSRSIT
jgi:hypothetical protein